jgi:hypothetical protein
MNINKKQLLKTQGEILLINLMMKNKYNKKLNNYKNLKK